MWISWPQTNCGDREDRFMWSSFAAFRRATLIANQEALVPWGRDFQIQNYLIIILFSSRHAKAQHMLQTLLFTLIESLLFQQIANLTCILIFTTKVKKWSSLTGHGDRKVGRHNLHFYFYLQLKCKPDKAWDRYCFYYGLIPPLFNIL